MTTAESLADVAHRAPLSTAHVHACPATSQPRQVLHRTHALLTGEGNYKGLVFDRGGTQLAFVSDRDEYARPRSRYALYHAPLGGGAPRAREAVAEDAAGRGMIVSGGASPRASARSAR